MQVQRLPHATTDSVSPMPTPRPTTRNSTHATVTTAMAMRFCLAFIFIAQCNCMQMVLLFCWVNSSMHSSKVMNAAGLSQFLCVLSCHSPQGSGGPALPAGWHPVQACERASVQASSQGTWPRHWMMATPPSRVCMLHWEATRLLLQGAGCPTAGRDNPGVCCMSVSAQLCWSSTQTADG